MLKADKTNNKPAKEKKRRLNTGCLRGVLYFCFALGASIFLSVFGWNAANDILALNKPDEEVTITIPEHFTIDQVSRILHDNGVIDIPWLFRMFARVTDAEETIEPGTFTINTRFDYNALIKSFVNRPVREEVRVVIPEGRNLMQTFEILAEAGVAPLEDLIAASEEEFSHSFLEGLEPGPGWLEGYLFPDTYIFFTDSNPRTAISRMLNQFGTMLTPSVRRRLDDIQYDLNEIITIASLIQLEAATVAEMRNVSSVIWNRLASPNFPFLEIDATSVYLIGIENVNSAADVLRGRQIESPYNTFGPYGSPGLPPGPIASPGFNAIRAALYPYNTNFYYYALSTDRTHRFFRSYSEFRNFLASDSFANF